MRPADSDPQLWERAARAPHRLLGVDYDGTLAPFRVEREAAVPSPAARAALAAIAAGRRTTVAVVSGRPVAELERLLPGLCAWMAGEHGWELRDPGGASFLHPLPEPAARALIRAESAARTGDLGSRLERKRTALVLHLRGLAPQETQRLQKAATALWHDLLEAGLRLDSTDGGLELRPVGRHKGTILLELLARLPDGTLAVYLGDDATDEDAFGVVRERGIGIRVGEARRASLATHRLDSCRAAAEFLRMWRARLESPGPEGGGT